MLVRNGKNGIKMILREKVGLDGQEDWDCISFRVREEGDAQNRYSEGDAENRA